MSWDVASSRSPCTSRVCAGACRTRLPAEVAGQRVRADRATREVSADRARDRHAAAAPRHVGEPARAASRDAAHRARSFRSAARLRTSRCASTIRAASAACTTPPASPSEHPLLAHLAPEPLDDAFNADYLWRITRRRSVAIKQLLMNSTLVVGVGNIYASEALFRARIRPATPGAQSQARGSREARARDPHGAEHGDSRRRHDAARLRRRGRQSRLFPAEALRVRARAASRAACARRPIRQITQGQRSTYYCPACQK